MLKKGKLKTRSALWNTIMVVTQTPDAAGGSTSIDKALAVCEALSAHVEGQSLAELARALELPAPTVHRLLAVLKRRGYVRQDEDTSWYRLTLKVLDLGFRQLGRSELKLHAYPLLREYALRTGARCFIAAPPASEVTYVWSAGPDEVAMHTAYGKEMPGHCSLYFDEVQATRRLSCLRLATPGDVEDANAQVVRLRADGVPGRWAASHLHVRTGSGLHGTGGCARWGVRSCGHRYRDPHGAQSRSVGACAADFNATGASPRGVSQRDRLTARSSAAAEHIHGGFVNGGEMAYTITEPCIGTKDSACVDVCPVDCIHPRKDEEEFEAAEKLYIHPDECIDCGACVPACPVEAIFANDEVPDQWKNYIDIDAQYYADK